MKQLKYNRMLAVALALGVTLSACDKDNDDDNNGGNATYTITDVTKNGVDYKEIAGNINQNITMSASNKYLLKDGIFVMSGSTLTIEPGTLVYGDNSDGVDFLTINQGAMINACGTAQNPIVMSSLQTEKGSWGGLIINGYGEINNGSTATAECNSGTYGGTDNADNSGTLCYVRIEYAGFICATDDELNGLTLNAVGSGTSINHVQIFKGADDGIEWFGGAAEVKYAIVTGARDDSFDCTHGWAGKGQFFVAHQDNISGDRGFEFDNNGDDNSALPWTNPTISNVTLVGEDDGDAENTGMRLREGAKFRIWNALVTNFPKHGIRVSDSITLVHVDNDDAFVSNASVFGLGGGGDAYRDCAKFTTDYDCDENAVNLSGFVGTSSSNANPNGVDGWFTSAQYRGACETGGNWWKGGWAKDVDGNIIQ